MHGLRSLIDCVLGNFLLASLLLSAVTPSIGWTDEAGSLGAVSKLQGEYLGVIAGNKQNIGLQAVAIDAAHLKIHLLDEGLPGFGYSAKSNRIADQPIELAVKSENGQATGWINQYAFELDGKQARIFDRGGSHSKPIATLQKVIRQSPTLGRMPPAGATQLTETDSHHDILAALVEASISDVQRERETVAVINSNRRCKLHIEFQIALDIEPKVVDPKHADSAIFLDGLCQISIVDSFGRIANNNLCGAIGNRRQPSLNMCLPPQSWQTYDIELSALKYDPNAKKISSADLTVLLNGFKIHDRVQISGSNQSYALGDFQTLSLVFSGGGDRVKFKNIWLLVEVEK